jgi:hypothetical protein
VYIEYGIAFTAVEPETVDLAISLSDILPEMDSVELSVFVEAIISLTETLIVALVESVTGIKV